MKIRSLCLLAVCFSLPSEADAGEQSGLFHRASCTVVRYYVAKYTAPAAEAWARSHGATDAEIEAARHCLQVMPVQAATVLSAEAPHGKWALFTGCMDVIARSRQPRPLPCRS